jgi:hypothetical protein
LHIQRATSAPIDQRLTYFPNRLTLITTRIRIRIGECANSLRSGLNYLTCECAERDSGCVGGWVQFPIFDSPESFKKGRKTYLEGIREEWVATFEKFQPYNTDCEWIALLREFSNFYKHRGLIVVKRAVHPYVTMPFQPALRFTVALQNGTPIVKTLEEILQRVNDVVHEFDLLIG